MEIEPLLTQIDQLSGRFGRVSGDLQAIVSRGRAEDFRGVMQNTRLVLEALMRDLVTRELKQTPGKAMLDELISKFRQSANSGIIPTNILAHMGTVQAWGNLSAHDHAGSLNDQGVHISQQEVLASLNSMVAILNWYAVKAGLTTGPTERALPPVPGAKSPLPKVVLAFVISLVVSGGGFLLLARPKAAAEKPADPCLADLKAAQKHYELLQAPGEELDRAVACQRSAESLSLLGKFQVREAEMKKDKELYEKAARSFDDALAMDQGFKNARFNRGLVRLKLSRIDEAMTDFQDVLKADPKFGEAHFFLGVAMEAKDLRAEAKEEYCEAAKQGVATAKSRCEAE